MGDHKRAIANGRSRTVNHPDETSFGSDNRGGQHPQRKNCGMQLKLANESKQDSQGFFAIFHLFRGWEALDAFLSSKHFLPKDINPGFGTIVLKLPPTISININQGETMHVLDGSHFELRMAQLKEDDLPNKGVAELRDEWVDCDASIALTLNPSP